MTWSKDTPKGEYAVGLALTFKDAGYLILAVRVKVN